ncbi:MAG: lysophospholipid acyltransferase family protein [Dokdonella sp.]
MSESHLPEHLAPSVPQLKSHVGRRLARGFIGLCGWKLVGEFPDVARLVLIAAPHSSWWDGIWGMLIKIAIGIDISFMGKRELFVGPLGWIVCRLGGIPVERSSTHGVVEQMAERFQRGKPLWLGIAPEGTRKPVKKWRTGFWHIARAANVPILPVYFHYPERTIGVGPLFVTSDDMGADLQRLREFYAPWQGRNRGIG